MNISERIKQEDAILAQIKTTLSGMGTFLDPNSPRTRLRERVAYTSHAVTTGRRLYQLFEAHDITSIAELNQIDSTLFKEQVMSPNIQDGINFGRALRKKGYGSVIVPGVFFADGWTQEHYMSLWKRAIVDYSDDVHFDNDWFFGNGSSQEFLIGLESGKTLFERRRRQPLTQQEGAQRIRSAIEYIDRIGANPNSLYNTYREIVLFKPKTVIDLNKNIS